MRVCQIVGAKGCPGIRPDFSNAPTKHVLSWCGTVIIKSQILSLKGSGANVHAGFPNIVLAHSVIFDS